MKRDHTTIKQRIDKLGLKQVFVAKKCGVLPVTLNQIMNGVKYRVDKNTVEKIHKYLDTVKT
jgi:transcriptional regulator with XRE-family HTH domain